MCCEVAEVIIKLVVALRSARGRALVLRCGSDGTRTPAVFCMARLHLLEGDAKLLRGHGKRFICLVCHGCELYLTPFRANS